MTFGLILFILAMIAIVASVSAVAVKKMKQTNGANNAFANSSAYEKELLERAKKIYEGA